MDKSTPGFDNIPGLSLASVLVARSLFMSDSETALTKSCTSEESMIKETEYQHLLLVLPQVVKPEFQYPRC